MRECIEEKEKMVWYGKREVGGEREREIEKTLLTITERKREKKMEKETHRREEGWIERVGERIEREGKQLTRRMRELME